MKSICTAAAIGVMSAAFCLVPSAALAADNQIRPFIGTTFHGGTTFVDVEDAAGRANLVVGVSFVSLGNVFGVEAEIADAPGFFQADRHLVLSSRVTTLTGNVVIAAPRRLTEYSLRPYFVAGGGLMSVNINDSLGALPVSRVLPAFDLGGGVTGFLTNRVGVSWEVRRFQNLYRQSEEVGLTFGNERLSYWRASMAVVFRY
jgi:hypothetical protein